MKIFCQKCGKELKENVIICPNCGYENKIIEKNKKKLIIIILILFLLIAGVTLFVLFKSGKFSIFTKLNKTVETFIGVEEYSGEDLVAGTLRQREEGAYNLEAYIEDKRDGKKYRIVKMPDDRWWMAENLNYQKGLYQNERSDYANSSRVEKPVDGTQSIGSYWCNDSVREWSIYDYENFDSYDYETQQNLIKASGVKPRSLEEIGTGYPGSKGSNNELKRLESCSKYGSLYPWETSVLQDGKGDWSNSKYEDYLKTNNICPIGWKLPSDEEWATLLNSIELETNGTPNHETLKNDGFAGLNAGKLLKSKNTSTEVNYDGFIWYDGSNSWWNKYVPEKSNPEIYYNYDMYGFSIYPAGGKMEGVYLGKSITALYWTSTQEDGSRAVYRSFDNDDPRVYRGNHPKYFGLSVRCIQDN